MVKIFKMSFSLFICVVFIFPTACSSKKLPEGDELGIAFTLVKNKTSRSDSILKIVLKNNTARVLFLDKRILNPIFLVEIYNANKKPLFKLPPPTPREVSPNDILELSPGKRIILKYRVREVIMDLPNELCYFKAKYNKHESHSEKAYNFWTGCVNSKTLSLPIKDISTNSN